MESSDSDQTMGLDPSVLKWVFGALGLLALAGFLAFQLLRRPLTPPPPDIASDPMLTRGREVYLERCVSCHGPEGRGDGPVAKIIQGPRVRNFVEEPWKHGEEPEKVYDVIANGVDNTQMSGWKGIYRPEDLRAVAAYVYYLGKKPIPDSLRKP